MRILKEENYIEEINQIRSRLDEIKVSGYFKGENNADIYYEYYKNKMDSRKNKAVVISHGYSENLVKFTELIHYFYQEGYSVYGIEHRGMARSTRLAQDKTKLHVENFMYYIEDFKTFVETIVKKEEKNNPLYLYAHSQGGLIATGYVEKYPKDFAKVALSAPFYRVHLKYPLWLMKLTARVLIKAGKEEQCVYINNRRGKDPKPKDLHTSSRARYEFNKSVYDDNQLFRIKGGTVRWIYECAKAQTEIFKKRNLIRLKPQILLISCGKDRMVDNKYHKKFKKAVYKCNLYEIEDSRHEAYFEREEILEKFYKKIFGFYNN